MSIKAISQKINLRFLILVFVVSLFTPFIHNSSAKAVASCTSVETIDGLYTVQTFSTTGTCQWSVPTGVTSLDSLVVAGGGGGASGTITDSTPAQGGGGGGGGGGQVIETTSRTVSAAQVITIVVGAGGNGGDGRGVSHIPTYLLPGNNGYTGGNSSISLASGWSTTAAAGVRATGAGNDINGAWGGDITIAGYGGRSGGGNIGANPSSRKAGQGASDNSGVTPTTSTSVVLGVSSSITGSTVVYAYGGGGGDETAAGSTGTTYGSGGGGGRSDVVNAGINGLSGVVIVRYLTPIPESDSGDSSSSTKSATAEPVNQCEVTNKVIIYFDGGSSSIDKNDEKKIKDLARLIKNCSFTKIVLTGYTSIDKPDSPSYALFRKNLSNKRANAVENVLLEKLGKSAKRIKFKSYAKSNAKPIKSNRTEKTRSANRRVEIVVN